ncbi:MAG: DNA-processing protein DprA [Candidatus Poribacteria bacterium]|nr:DNA-processing protein DprA [Candidatus Poribacteria bacterium]
MVHFDDSEVQEIGLGDPNYSKLLQAIRKSPKTLRFRGSLPPNTKIIAISGSRKTTEQALQTAYRIGKMLAEHGYTIVTGLAEGCDEAAVEGALSAEGNVIGVIPCGLGMVRSQPRKRLAQEIFAIGGAVISEYADNLSTVFRRHYLRRNEIITGLSEKTIIIAANTRSGSLATANRALKQGREVIVTPHVTAKIEGATIVRNLGELKDAIGITRN